MEVILEKTLNNHFKLLYGSDFDKAQKIRIGEQIKAKLSKPRNYEFHKKFFALVRLCFDNLPEQYAEYYPTQKHLLNELKFQTGYFTEHRTIGGKTTFIPSSISFAKMDDLEFRAFYEKCVNVILKHFLKGVQKKDLQEMVALNF